MITRKQVVIAMKILRGEVHPDSNGLLKQLALSLKVYQNRKEFEGTVQSAIECLELAGYEIEHKELM